MREGRIIAIGDNVVDKYLSRGKMYPGGQCVNTSVYAKMNGARTAYLGKFGDDAAARHNCQVLTELGVDFSHSRHFHGENGAARVTLRGSDRVFLGSNKGGVSKEHPYDFTGEDLDYIRGFDLIYTNTNSYILDDLPLLYETGVPIAFDFSAKWDDAMLEQICPYVTVALLSCSHMTQEERENEMKKAAQYGVKIVVGTVGENGSYVLSGGEFLYENVCWTDDAFDTMGAGDAYFSAFLTDLLKGDKGLDEPDPEEWKRRLQKAMRCGAEFSAKICCVEGAFGYGTAIVDG